MSSFQTSVDTRPERGPRAGRRLVAVLLLLGALAGIAGLVGVVLAVTSAPDVKPGKRVRVTIPANADGSRIATVLADAGVVRNRVVFVARLRFNGDGTAFRPGTYTMRTMSSYQTIVSTLEAGPPAAPVFDVTIPEGMRVSEVAQLITRLHDESAADGLPLPRFTGRDYLRAVRNVRVPARYGAPKGTTSMEGFLFPATYELKRSATAEDLVAKQMEAFDDRMSGIDLGYAKARNLTAYEVVTIASMVEREARLDAERAKIAGVIYNRLRERMTLGIDATIQYAVSSTTWKRNLTESDLAIDSPYNTRLRMGLPPTPIANPGLASLEAAAHPAKVDYLYYVADPAGSGRHHFHVSDVDFYNDPYQQ